MTIAMKQKKHTTIGPDAPLSATPMALNTSGCSALDSNGTTTPKAA